MVANLAATFADVGKRVVVICCDYRHPSLHATFGVEHEPGLTDALQGESVADLDSLIQDTAIERVRVLATGAVPDKSGSIFGSDRIRQVLAGLRSVADVVLIDTAPVLAASDWTQLLPQVDAVVVVARAGRTDAGSARRTAEVLQLLQAPVVGVALNAVPRGLIRQATDRSWYQYQEPERRRPRSGDGHAVERPAEPVMVVDGIGVGLLDRLDERAELRRRMQVLGEPDRRLLYLWYVAQLPATRIAQALGISRRQCFRRRASAVKRIVEFGTEPAA
jgi:capsular exopolysaccharide synthesis family protein